MSVTLNGKACSGLVITVDSMTAALTKSDFSQLDPDSLILDPKGEVDYDEPEGGFPATEEGGVAECRAWYDAKKYDGPYCCQI